VLTREEAERRHKRLLARLEQRLVARDGRQARRQPGPRVAAPAAAAVAVRERGQNAPRGGRGAVGPGLLDGERAQRGQQQLLVVREQQQRLARLAGAPCAADAVLILRRVGEANLRSGRARMVVRAQRHSQSSVCVGRLWAPARARAHAAWRRRRRLTPAA
jgi:hypothetical protein